MEEIWKDVPSYENIYQASNLGRVRSLDRFTKHKNGGLKSTKGRVLIHQLHRDYCYVCLCKDGVQRRYSIHQVVSMAFLAHKRDGFNAVVDHINHNPEDNRLENLQILSHRDNISRAIRTTNSSNLLGVTFDKRWRKYRSAVSLKGENISLGASDSEQYCHDLYTCAVSNLDKYDGDKAKFRALIQSKVSKV